MQDLRLVDSLLRLLGLLLLWLLLVLGNAILRAVASLMLLLVAAVLGLRAPVLRIGAVRLLLVTALGVVLLLGVEWL